MGLTRARKSGVVWIVCLVAGLAMAAVTAAGQERFGSLNGIAMDESGAVLPGVTVTVTNKTTNRAVSVVTGGDGTYTARNIEPGRYSVQFELPGFSTLEFPDINLLVGQTLKIDGSMMVGGVETTLEVEGIVPLIDTQSTLVAHNISAEEFDNLPKGRSFQSLAIAAPAVNTGDIEGGIQVNGASGAENVYNIDGITTNSGINGASRQNAPFEYLSEVQIKTAGIEAEYGGALGGVITGVTKSGGNEFHGEGHFYWTDNRFGASAVKRLVLDPRDPALNTVVYIQDNKYPIRQYEPGFSVGGPIVANKLFFFSSLSPRFVRETRPYLYSSGTDPGEQERNKLSTARSTKFPSIQCLASAATSRCCGRRRNRRDPLPCITPRDQTGFRAVRQQTCRIKPRASSLHKPAIPEMWISPFRMACCSVCVAGTSGTTTRPPAFRPLPATHINA